MKNKQKHPSLISKGVIAQENVRGCTISLVHNGGECYYIRENCSQRGENTISRYGDKRARFEFSNLCSKIAAG